MSPWTSKNTSSPSPDVLARDEVHITKSTAQSKMGLSTLLSMHHVPREIQTQQEQHTLRIVFTLLAVLCLFCLGSFPLVSHMLLTIPPRSQQQIAISNGGGVCITKSDDIRYLQTSQSADQQPLLSQWARAGLSKQDFTYAQICAASFVIAYQSFSFNQAKTFEASTAFLTSQAKKRFYGQIPGSTIDERMDPLWRAGIQKQQIEQSAQITQPNIITIQPANKRMLAWLHVGYKVTVSRQGNIFTLPPADMTILLVSLPPGQLSMDTQWQISAWQEGTRAFALPSII